MSTFESEGCLIHRAPVRIREYEDGALIGDYTGYYDANRQTVRLIPRPNPFIVAKYRFKEISDRLVIVKVGRRVP